MSKEGKELEYKYKYHKFLNTLVVIKNSISLICCTILAIVFKNVLIVLLALLFCSYIDKSDEEKESEDKQ